MVSTRRKMKQNKKIRRHLDEFADIAMERLENQNTQTESRVDTVYEKLASGTRNPFNPS